MRLPCYNTKRNDEVKFIYRAVLKIQNSKIIHNQLFANIKKVSTPCKRVNYFVAIKTNKIWLTQNQVLA